MYKFYWELLKVVPKTLLSAFNRGTGLVAFILFVLALFNRPLGTQLTNTWKGTSPWWSLLLIGFFFIYGMMKANYEHIRTSEIAYNKSLDGCKEEIIQLRAMLPSQGRGLSQKGKEILVATLEGLKQDGSRYILVDGGSPFITAGQIRLMFSDPVETAEYMAEVKSLSNDGWITYVEHTNVDVYELSSKGLKKAKQLFGSGTAENMLADLFSRLSQGA